MSLETDTILSVYELVGRYEDRIRGAQYEIEDVMWLVCEAVRAGVLAERQRCAIAANEAFLQHGGKTALLNAIMAAITGADEADNDN